MIHIIHTTCTTAVVAVPCMLRRYDSAAAAPVEYTSIIYIQITQIIYTWGMISPKMVMITVARAKPTKPEVSCAITIDSNAFTATFPSSSVHSSRLPSARTGWIFCTNRRMLQQYQTGSFRVKFVKPTKRVRGIVSSTAVESSRQRKQA